MFLTLSEVQTNYRIKSVIQKCPTSEDGIGLINAACQRLMRRGDFAGTVVPIQVCVYSGCIVWPRYVDHVRKMNLCGFPLTMRNTYYSFLQYQNPRFFETGRYGYGLYGGANAGNWWGSSSWGGMCGAQAYVTGEVETPVFQDIMGDGRLLRFYPIAQADVGKTVTVFGTDNYGNTLRHKLSDGSWEDGCVVTIADPYGSTADYVRKIDRFVFEDHESTIRCYAYNVAEDVLEDIGLYEGHDNNPTFKRYNLTTGVAVGIGCNNGSTTGCGCTKSVIALVKLRFVPARYATDLVLINNFDALALMIQCINAEQAGDRGGARAFEADAIRELNLQLTDAYPLEQTPIGNGVFANTGIGQQRAF